MVMAQTDQARQNAARFTTLPSRARHYARTVPGSLPLAGGQPLMPGRL
jgi:hypothetical protein